MKAQALYSYESQGKNELSLRAGEWVTVVTKGDEGGWWRGKAGDGRTGWFPSSYVKMAPSQPQQQTDLLTQPQPDLLMGALTQPTAAITNDDPFAGLVADPVQSNLQPVVQSASAAASAQPTRVSRGDSLGDSLMSMIFGSQTPAPPANSQNVQPVPVAAAVQAVPPAVQAGAPQEKGAFQDILGMFKSSDKKVNVPSIGTQPPSSHKSGKSAGSDSSGQLSFPKSDYACPIPKSSMEGYGTVDPLDIMNQFPPAQRSPSPQRSRSPSPTGGSQEYKLSDPFPFMHTASVSNQSSQQKNVEGSIANITADTPIQLHSTFQGFGASSNQQDDDASVAYDGAFPFSSSLQRQDTSSYTFKIAPIWQHPAFADLFLGPYEYSRLEEEQHPVGPSIKPGLNYLSLSLDFSEQLLRTVAGKMGDQASKKTINGVADVIQDASELSNKFPVGKRNANAFYNFLYDLISRISLLSTPGALVIPVGWHTAPDEEGKTGQPCLLLGVLFRHSETQYSFTVCNGGHEALEWHPMLASPASGGMKHALSLEVKQIPASKVTDASFWFLLLKGLVYPQDKPQSKGILFGSDDERPLGGHMIYERLLPYLNSRPLMTNIASVDEVDWMPTPLGQNHANCRTVMQCIRHLLLLSGLQAGRANHALVLLKASCLEAAIHDLSVHSSGKLSSYHAHTLKLASKVTSRGASELAPFKAKLPPQLGQQLLQIKQSIERLEEMVDKATTLNTVTPQLPVSRGCMRGSAVFPLWGRLRRDQDVEALAGAAALPPILRPVELTLVPDVVANFAEAASAMRRALHVCTLLANQVELIKNSYLLRISVLHHLFTRVLPIPLPQHKASECFWQSSQIRYETQADLLRLLLQCSRQYAAACLSLPLDRLSDATRLLTMACIASMADAVMRKQACDIPSQCSLHYAGKVLGPGSQNAPVKPFGFEMGYFAQESEYIMLPTPHLHAIRTRVLDYFDHQRKLLDESHIIFRFEESLEYGEGEAMLIDQLCVQMGFARGARSEKKSKKSKGEQKVEDVDAFSNQTNFESATYLTGEAPEMLENYPEMGFLRDIVYLLKAFMSPIAEYMPPTRPYRPHEAILKWRFSDNVFKVSGFGIDELQCAAFTRKLEGQKGSFLDRVFSLFRGQTKTRAPPSAANPSVLASQPVNTEDDILHLKEVPDFDGRLSASDSELLLSYLTAPYLRIPLVLQLLSAPSKLMSLASPALQAVVDACLFEPGPWQPDQPKSAPELVPEISRCHLSTPSGLLFNELLNSPQTLLDSIQGMLDTALDLDGGRYIAASSKEPSSRAVVILYVIRLAVRVQGFMRFLLENTEKHYRGIDHLGAVEEILQDAVKTLRTKLFLGALPMIEQWLLKLALEETSTNLHACVLHAHIVFLHKHINQNELDFSTISCFLSSQVFLIINYPFYRHALEEGDKSQVDLGICIQEIFDIFTEHRVKILQHLQNNPEVCNEVMESIIRVVTFTGPRNLSKSKGMVPRKWQSLQEENCVGRFLPDIDMAELQEKTATLQAETFEEWLRLVTTLRVSTEINVQLGELTLKKNHMELLHERIARMPDFKEVYEQTLGIQHYDPASIQCAEVKNTTNRIWVRLVGQRHDLMCWAPDKREFVYHPEFGRIYSPGRVKTGEGWICDIFEPLRKRLLPNMDFKMLKLNASKTQYAILIGSHLDDPGDNKKPVRTVKEVVISRAIEGGLVQVFNLVEYGRRFFRQLVFSSNAKFCLHDLPPYLDQDLKDHESVPSLVCGHPLTPEEPHHTSLVITRNLHASLGLQKFIPSRLVQGLLPAALLDQYHLWQNEDDSFTGYPKRFSKLNSVGASAPSLRNPSVLQIELSRGTDIVGFGQCNANAVIRRIPLPEDPLAFLEKTQGATPPPPNGPTLTLLDLLHNPLSGTAVRDLALLLTRMEKLSHILVWTQDTISSPDTPCDVSVVELPRMGIRFVAKNDLSGTRRLYSDNHDGLFISTRDDAACELLKKGLPHSLVLENDKKEIFILVPAFNPIRIESRNRFESIPGTQQSMIFSAESDYWREGLGETRHFLYPVHTCERFLLPQSYVSTLYLFLMKFVFGEYEEVFRMTEACVSDLPLTSEEAAVLARLSIVAWDPHPNAHACRLRFWVVAQGTSMEIPWEIEYSLLGYISKIYHISAGCRLTVSEELFLIGHCKRSEQFTEEASAVVANRQTYLEIKQRMRNLPAAQQGADAKFVHVVYPKQAEHLRFDTFSDHTAINMYDGLDRKQAKALSKKISNIFGTMSYSRPVGTEGEDIAGVDAVDFLIKMVDKGMDLHGKSNNLGFLFFYELMTESLGFRILPNDNTHRLGACLLRLLPPKQTQKTSELMSILRILSANPKLAPGFPKFEDDRKIKFSTIFKGSDLYKRLVDNAGKYISNHRAALIWPDFLEEYNSPDFIQFEDMRFSVLRIHPKTSSQWTLSPFTCLDSERVEIGVSQHDIEILLSSPLQCIRLEDYVTNALAQGATSERLPFDVSKHFMASSHVGTELLSRMHEDMNNLAQIQATAKNYRLKFFEEQSIQSYLAQSSIGPANAMLERLFRSLESLEISDTALAFRGIAHILSAINSDPASLAIFGCALDDASAGWLMKHSGREPNVGFEFVVALMQSAKHELALRSLCPLLPQDQVQLLQQVYQVVLLRISRISLIRRCLASVRSLQATLQKLGKTPGNTDSLYHEILQHANSLAELLKTRRHFVKQGDMGEFLLDPRMMTIEFSKDILLRKAQVVLAEKLVGCLGQGQSSCHQMIMGAGKTCVVTPLLVTMLADGKRMVVQLVPEQLLEMGLGVLRTHLCVILQKPVYTLIMDRYTSINQTLLDKFVQARATGAVVLTTPSSLKSLMLKFIEIIHLLDQSDTIAEYTREVLRERGLVASLFKSRKSSIIPANLRVMRVPDCANLLHEAQILESIFKIFRASGVLILDEVDTILHPLKSELNWPLGAEKPLDFTTDGAMPEALFGNPSSTSFGLRWQIPIHLLVPIFFFNEPRLPSDVVDSRTAEQILEKMKSALQRGCDEKLLQKIPHLVLLDIDFYKTSLRPLFAQWMLLWLRQKRLTSISDEIAFKYLRQGPRGDSNVLLSLKQTLSDEQMKMINLSYDWLEMFLPHILSKINRVSYGLLTPNDIGKATKDMPNMPRSRKLLSVPFVGKDVPSRASEFSHPDIVIGLTIMSYRYEGLRRSDFLQVLRMIRDQMEDEHGPYLKRRSCQRYVRWVDLAGGRVRGTKKSSGLDHKSQNFSQESIDMILLLEEPEVTDSPSEFDSIWPLQLVDSKDEEQVDVLFRLLHRLPEVIEYYLHVKVFPDTMVHKGLKLQANGQDVGGDLFFPVRLAFSGTPSDLLPLELGQCNYERGDTARMVDVLTSPDTMSVSFCPQNWNVESLLKAVANSPIPYHALIDSGALVTGMTNLEVGIFLLTNGLCNFDGVVFLDDLDRKMVVCRPNFVVLSLSQCNIPKGRRFTFFDQVHTTGMDIPQELSARAYQSLGKDVTFRDYAQGAFRMRGIGQGQTITILLIPEVWKLVKEEVASGAGIPLTQKEQQLEMMSGAARMAQILQDVCGWATINSIRSERIQFNLLCEQRAANVWRKQAYADLRGYAQMARDHAQLIKEVASQTQQSLNVFRERVDHTVENTVPRGRTFAEKVAALIQQYSSTVTTPSDTEILSGIQALVQQVEAQDKVNRKRITEKKPVSIPFVAPKKKMCVARYKYESKYDTDISLRKGDLIEVHKEAVDWWEGTLQRTGERGHFPSNYVKILPEEKSSPGGPESSEIMLTAPSDETKEQDKMEAARAFIAEQVQEKEQEQETEQEQEITQEKEEEVMPPEPEEFLKQKYSRDHEGPFPWRLDALAQAPSQQAQGFYPVSEFRVFTKLFSKPKGLDFPPDLLMSTNYFPSKYTVRSYRRIKNVIMVLEWAPSLPQLSRWEDSQMRWAPDAEERLRRSFSMLDVDGDGRLSQAECLGLFWALDVDNNPVTIQTISNMVDQSGAGVLNFSQVKQLVQRGLYRQAQNGRFFVALSLSEAETLRGALHMSSEIPVLSGMGFGGSSPALGLRIAGGKLLDRSNNFRPASNYQQGMAQQSFRFVDSQVSYNEKEIGLLLRGVQTNDMNEREQFFNNVRACRRRRQVALSTTPLNRIFKLSDELELLEYRATINTIRCLIRKKGMHLMDAFLAFNFSHTGALSCSELYGGLQWLGLVNLQPEQIHKIVQSVDLDGDGLLSFNDFKTAFEDAFDGDDESWIENFVPADRVDVSTIPRVTIPELNKDLAQDGSGSNAKSTKKPKTYKEIASIIHQFKVKLVKAGAFTRVWTSKGVLTQGRASIWSPVLDTGFLHRNKTLVCLGHYAVKDFLNPSKFKSNTKMILEVTDTSSMMLETSENLEAVLNATLPRPVRFRQVWRKEQAKRPLFVWQAIPPTNDFVAMGMIATLADEPPPLSSMRCVPLKWLVPCQSGPTAVWDDKGTEGRPGSIWFASESLQTFLAHSGHDAPRENCYDFKSQRFFLSSEDLNSF